MPTTRGQSQRFSQTATAGVDSNDEDASESESGFKVSEHTKLRYDMRQLSVDSWEHAMSSFKAGPSDDHHLAIDQCADRNPMQGVDYFAFQMSETVKTSIRIRSSDNEIDVLTCEPCNAGGASNCRHVFWLLDQIAARFITLPQGETPLTLTKAGYAAELPDPFEQITRVGIRELAEQFGCELTQGEGSQPEQSSSTSTGDRRAQEVREIMAALSHETSENYRPDIFDNIPDDLSKGNSLVRRDLESTLARSLITDDTLFRHLRFVVTPEHRAIDYFDKMGDKAREAMRLLRESSTNAAQEGGEVHDVAWCAAALKEIVASIRDCMWNSTTALSPESKKSAVRQLISILDDVVNHDKDTAEGAGRAPKRQRTAPLKKENLYERLVALRPNDEFVIGEVHDFGEAGRDFVQDLEDILKKIEGTKSKAPATYLRRLQRLIRNLKTGEERRMK